MRTGISEQLLAITISTLLFILPVHARQATTPATREAMYQRHLDFASNVKGGSVEPHWMADGSSFWYAEGALDSTVIWKVDPRANTRVPLFDTQRLRAAIAEAIGGEPDGKGIPFREFEFLPGETAVGFRLGQREFILDLSAYAIRDDPAAAKERERVRPRIVGRGLNGDILEVLSTDRRWFATVSEHNLWVRPVAGGPDVQLTKDGVAGYSWDVEEAVWSPDASRLVAMKVGDRGVAKVPVVDWLGTTETVEWKAPFRPTAGGPLRRTELFIFDVASRKHVRVDTGSDDQYTYVAGWRRGGAELVLLRMSRDFKRLDLLSADSATGVTRTILTDTRESFLWGNLFNYRGWREQIGLFTMLDDGDRFVWMSERDGWSHFYLYDFDGRLLRRLTSGTWPVEGLVAVDEKWIYFTAHGDSRRPYDMHVYRAGLEHEGFEQLTNDPGRHAPALSPSREFLLDSHSSLDRPPRVDLRKVDGTLLQTVSRADIEGLKALRWLPPEEFTGKAADGRTDLYGVIYKPFDFDPKRTYPVLEIIYAGPQVTEVPRTFEGSNSAFAQLGFIVVMLDARGTPERGKEFQDVVYGNFGRNEIPDHVAVLKQIAKQRPYMDMKRVGVVGRSYGGYFAIRAMLLAPEVYRVGVAAASVVELYGHNSRIEPYMDLPSRNPDAYEYASNLRLAAKLDGKLLMIHGTADVNAPISQTMKMVDALVRVNKPFDLLVLPGVAHFPTGDAERYWIDAVRRYFVEHLHP